MFRAVKTGPTAVALTARVLTFTAGPAQAVTDFRKRHMHRTFENGVARSDAAADRQVRTGHFQPAVRPRVYRVDNESDADNDGTADEVSR